ncbi:MAG: DUF2723 domain-containing protein [Kiritimatiellia bacterium]|nr:DUF2723 domain-containing protein [Kiritimatiellia bacterium]MDP6631021.1 DUF2723 domain-containing protein [Kiritimatiellia bacterium]MDP6809977.1 DUF2723 domain-containing protein [Kiritimatiellia bacterium]MDP7024748.1 DUF2723 domain-containing protein [Kiritimatiellia bacterium]
MDIQQETRFFRRLDWSAFWTACLASFVVYLWTLAPTVTLEDGGELAVAADALGVPHPPGYPIWTMICWLFTRIFSFVQFRGQPNPSWSVGLASVVFGALATGATAMLICRSGSEMLKDSRGSLHAAGEKTEDVICWIGGVVSSLLFAFSPVMWSQSVIVEVYSLNAFFLVWVFLLTYHWMRRPSDRFLYLTAFVFGLGLTNYQVLLLAALPLVFAVFLRDIKLFRDFAITGAPYMVALALIKRWESLPKPVPSIDSIGDIFEVLFSKGALPPIIHPSHETFAFYMVGNFVILLLAFFLLPRGRTVAISLLLMELGIGFYIYMPIVSDLRNPPMNWGYPRTWEGFKHAISRGQYERIKPADMFSARFIDQLGAYLTDLRGQFTLPVALIGFLPFTAWRVKVFGRRFNAMYAAICLAVLATALVVLQRLFGAIGMEAAAQVRLDKYLIGIIILFMGAGGASIFVTQGEELIEKLRGKVPTTISERITIGIALLGIIGAYFGFIGILATRIGRVTAPLRKAGAAVDAAQLWEIVGQSGGIVILMVLPTVAAIAILWMRRSRLEFQMTIDPHTQKWIIATLLGFLAMSLMLIALANPKGDIQDTFIQRVKFISSHALYAFWIGYGLICGLAVFDTVFKKGRPLVWLSLAVACALPLVPLRENAYNKELIRTYGGAEQNGHDFGWQFGNYQLRGAEAISEELDPHEEPLPNPVFPPAMTQNAIFYGGTDPGRFVPTYMIYSARVREDVYLITQNALADNTFMSVTRDLYGDQIWIPAEPDSARSFQRYVEEVNAGKRPKNAALKIENGRVQVSGALGVMEINGILAQMIFEHNNYRHDFYVEESYVIRWMYPYLTPHGLIMKINAKKTPLDTTTIRNDQDFWDWYTRRLTRDSKFRRDIVARKSFSKLRSAIAGLYANRGKFDDAELAFHQARTLYPLSPEANFRLTQEVLLRQRRIDESRDLMLDFQQRDPHNQKVPGFLNHLNSINSMNSRIAELQKLAPQGKLDIGKALELARLYFKAGLRTNYKQLLDNIAGNKGLPPNYQLQIAQLYQQGGHLKEMGALLDQCRTKLPANTPANVYLTIARMYAAGRQPNKTMPALETYLKKAPNDWKARVDMAVMQLSTGDKPGAINQLKLALAKGGAEAQNLIGRDARFNAIRKDLQSPRPNVMALPGLLPSAPKR